MICVLLCETLVLDRLSQYRVPVLEEPGTTMVLVPKCIYRESALVLGLLDRSVRLKG